MSTELRVENYSLEKNNMLTNHDSNRNRNMSRIDEGKESETNEDKQKNEVRDAFTIPLLVKNASILLLLSSLGNH